MVEKLEYDVDDQIEIKLLFLSLKHGKIALLVQIVVGILDVLAYIYCIAGKVLLDQQVTQTESKLVLFISCLSDTLLAAMNLYAVIIFLRSSFIAELVNSLRQSKFTTRKEPSRLFSRFIQIFRLAPIFPIMTEAYFIGHQFGWNVYLPLIPRSLWYFSHNVLLCSSIFILERLQWNFAALNDYIEGFNDNNYLILDRNVYVMGETYGKLGQPIKPRLTLGKLVETSRQYSCLCDLLDKFNRFLRYFVVMAVVSVTINLLYNGALLVEFGGKQRPNDRNDAKGKPFVFVIHIAYAVITVGQAAVGAFEGENLQDEGERTSSICYSLLTKMNRASKNENQNLMVKELEFLLDQSKSRRICLHAGGFFEVNWGILGSITSTVATYSIVIIQFLLK